MKNNIEKNNIKESKKNVEWKEEDEKDHKELIISDAFKNDIHSSKDEVPLGLSEEEYLRSFRFKKTEEGQSKKESEKLEEEKKEDENKYYDTGIRPHVKLPSDKSDEWPVIIPNHPIEKKDEEKEKNKKNKE